MNSHFIKASAGILGVKRVSQQELTEEKFSKEVAEEERNKALQRAVAAEEEVACMWRQYKYSMKLTEQVSVLKATQADLEEQIKLAT